MYIGIDLGTSGLKLVLMAADGQIVDTHTEKLTCSRPQPLHSEQKPEDWAKALTQGFLSLSSRHDLKKVLAMGLSGQMHGAVLLDKAGKVLRPAILWNDGRSHQECETLETQVPNSRTITGNIMMPGFTAPKLLWVKHNEPEIFAQINKVLLPKDYIRYLLSGDYASDMSDSAGTMWMDVGKRTWNAEILLACGLTKAHMPSLYEGSEVTGYLSETLATSWSLNTVPIVAGGGDNACGAIGVGLTRPGQGMLSLGTSGVYFVVSDQFTSNPDSAVHSFCHAIPNSWHLMSVVLSAASCVSWFAENIAKQDLDSLLSEVGLGLDIQPNSPYFLPYLTGERTPHNNPHARGVFFGMDQGTDKARLFYAVIEGVTYALAQGVEALHASGTKATEIMLIGGGANHVAWRQLIADTLNIPIIFCDGGEVGPGLGAAKLAQVAIEKQTSIDTICHTPDMIARYQPNHERHAMLVKRQRRFANIYQQLNPLFIQED